MAINDAECKEIRSRGFLLSDCFILMDGKNIKIENCKVCSIAAKLPGNLVMDNYIYHANYR